MGRQDLIDNLGTVARSGTRAFMSKLAEAKDGSGLIGQFGVGFDPAFMVADRIEVVSRHAGAKEAWAWTSSGGGGFEIAPASEAQAARVSRGTEIVLHLKEDAKKYLEPYESGASSRPIRITSCSPSNSPTRKASLNRSTPQAPSGSGRNPS